MIEAFVNYLKEKKIELTEEELAYIDSFAVRKKLRKKQFLLEEGQVSQNISFIIKGCLRTYRIKDDGTEHILRFAVENWWINDLESYSNGFPSKVSIDALEDSELLSWTKENFDELLKNIPSLSNFRQMLLTRTFAASQERIFTSISYTAEEKYKDFIGMHPDIANRVPLQMIASYLGVSRETLTRIRKSLITKG